MTACLLKPALYVLQCLNAEKANASSGRRGADGKNGSNNGASKNGACKLIFLILMIQD